MIEVRSQDRLPSQDERGFPQFGIALAIMAVVALGAGALYWHFALRTPDYSEVYKQLDIPSLPSNVERLPEFQRRLSQLGREPCYREALLALSNQLIEAGYPREGATSVLAFIKRCGDSANEELLVRAYIGFDKVGDFRRTLEIVNQLVEADPADAQYRYWRGGTHEKTKSYSNALTDYITTLQLLETPSRVAFSHYYDIARMYAALGRFCDAISPIETFISFNPAKNRTAQLTRAIAELAEKGRCDAKYARGIARVPLQEAAGVPTLTVVVNGVPGTFLLDSGATYVAVTSEFSARAKINIEAAGQLPMKTVGGAMTADLGYAATISVGNAEADGVAVAIVPGSDDPFGGRVDGLLGMSFLARFNVNLSQNGIEFSAIPLR